MSIRPVRLQRQPHSPFWYADYHVWHAGEGVWKRKFESTRHTLKSKAWDTAVGLQETAWAAYQGTISGWSRDRAAEVFNDLLKAAGLPLFRLSASWRDYRPEWENARLLHEAGGMPLKASTVAVYKRSLDRFEAWLGPKADAGMETISAGQIQAYYREIRKGGLGVATAKIELSLISSVFARAKEEGYLLRNPCALVRLDADLSGQVKKEPFTRDDVQRLLKEASQMPEWAEEWETLILLALCTGARLQDCARMGLAHLDDSRRVWLLTYKPKKNERRGTVVEVPVVEPLYGRLAYLKMLGESALFCPHLATVGHLSNTFSRMMARAGIRTKTYTNPVTGRTMQSKSFHSFRHTLPSWLKAAGVDEETRMRIVGHASKEIHRGYTHIEMRALADALQKGLGGLGRLAA